MTINTNWNGHKYYATLDGYDGSPDAIGVYSLVGCGNTEAEAINDLKDALTDPDVVEEDEYVRFCMKCGHSDVGHNDKGCKGGSCLCWLTRADMKYEKNLEPKRYDR